MWKISILSVCTQIFRISINVRRIMYFFIHKSLSTFEKFFVFVITFIGGVDKDRPNPRKDR